LTKIRAGDIEVDGYRPRKGRLETAFAGSGVVDWARIALSPDNRAELGQ